MTVDIGTPVARRSARRPHHGTTPRSDYFGLGLAAVIVAQAVWLAVLMSRGWYYEADLANLAAPTGRGLTLSYLTESQGGHIGVVSRLIFWVLNRVGPLDHPLTIVVRLALQAVATYLLARLLVMLVGRRAGVLAVLALYAMSPLLVQSTLWLTSSLGFLTSQVFVLLTLLAHVRYATGRQLRWAAATAGALIAAMLCAEQAAAIALTLPVLSLAYLHPGTPDDRGRATLREWPEWAMIVAPVGAFAAVLLGSGRYHSGRVGLTLDQGISLVEREISTALVPALVGGPFHWDPVSHHYFAFAAPTDAIRIVSGVLMVLLVALTVRRTGRVALAAWSMPLIVASAGIIVVGIGRYRDLGVLITQQLEHTAFTAVPAAVALALAWWRTAPQQIAERAGASSRDALWIAQRVPPPPLPPPPAALARRRSLGRRTAAAAVLAVVAASSVSAISYDNHWAKAPTRHYLGNLDAALRAHPGVNLFDTFVDPSILPGITSNRHISDLTALLGAHPRFEDATPAPRVVGPDGRIVAAVFVRSAAAVDPIVNSFCSNPVTGIVDRVEPLDRPTHATEWFLRLSYFQQHPSAVRFTLVDAAGHETAPLRGDLTVLSGTLASLYVHFPESVPVAIHIRSNSAATNVCLTDASVGYPFAVKP